MLKGKERIAGAGYDYQHNWNTGRRDRRLFFREIFSGTDTGRAAESLRRQRAVFSAIPVAAFEGALTALARLLKPVLTEEALFYLSMIGSILIFCVGLNLVWGKKVRVANMLPALVLAVAAAFLPVGW